MSEHGGRGGERDGARIVLLLPTATYRATDFVRAATGLGIEVVVASDRRQTLAATMGHRALVVPFLSLIHI